MDLLATSLEYWNKVLYSEVYEFINSDTYILYFYLLILS